MPPKGFKQRFGWHAVAQPEAAHLKRELASGERRVWARVTLSGRMQGGQRPEGQGGYWYTAQYMTIEEVL